MQKRLPLVFTLLILATPWLAAAEAGKEEDPLGADAKMDRKVTIAAEGIPVGELLAAVSKKVGLALRADRAIADEKVIVFGPARPLRAVLSDIATLSNDNWRHYKNVDGDEQYVLYRDPKAMRYEDGLENSVAAKMQAQLDEQVRALNETPEQFAKRPETDRVRQNFAKPILHGRTATRLYGLLSRQQKDALFAQGYLNVSFVATGSAEQATVRDAFKEAVAGLEKENERVQQENPDVHIVIDSPEALARSGIRFNLHQENNAGLSGMVVQIILGKASYMTMGTFDCDLQWILPPHGNPYTRKSVPPETDMAEAKAIAPAAKADGWVEQLRVFAEKSERPIVADFYRCPPLVKPLPTNEATEQKGQTGGFDGFCKPHGYLWWTEGKTVLFRKRDWYRQRQYEVSDRWIRGVAKRLQQKKRLPTYGDLASLLDLTPRQMAGLNNLLAGDGGTPYDVDTLAGVPELLQVLGAAATPDAPIYEGSLSPEVVARIALPRGGVAPALRSPVAAFLTARRQITALVDVARFHVCLTCYGPMPASKQDEPSPDSRGKATVVVEWNPGPNQTPYDQRLQLYLPTELPNDRSNKTKMEMVE